MVYIEEFKNGHTKDLSIPNDCCSLTLENRKKYIYTGRIQTTNYIIKIVRFLQKYFY